MHAPTALKTIGANNCATIVGSAIDLLSPFPPDCDARSDAIDDASDDIDDRLNALDSQFFAYPDDIHELLFAFVANHSREFGELPGSENSG